VILEKEMPETLRVDVPQVGDVYIKNKEDPPNLYISDWTFAEFAV